MAELSTFGPTFRAENSHTTRHLAEFWMVEPEMAFYDLTDNVELAEALLKYPIRFVLEQCPDDLSFLHQRELIAQPQKKEEEAMLPLLDRLELIMAQPFERVTYTDAIAMLKASKPTKKGIFFYLI